MIPLPRPLRSAPGDRRPTRDAFTYREPYEQPSLAGGAIVAGVCAAVLVVPWLVEVIGGWL